MSMMMPRGSMQPQNPNPMQKQPGSTPGADSRFWVLIGFGILCSLPSMAFVVWIYINRLQNNVAIRKRRKTLLNIVVISMWFVTILDRPIAWGFWTVTKPVYQVILTTTALSGNTLVAWGLTARYWLLYYDIKMSHIEEDHQWHIHLDHDLADANRLWYIEHRKTFGGTRWVIQALAVMIFLGAIKDNVVAFQTASTSFVSMFITIFAVIPLITVATFWYLPGNVPDFFDTLGVRKELRVVGIYLLFAYTLITVTAFLEMMYKWMRFYRYLVFQLGYGIGAALITGFAATSAKKFKEISKAQATPTLTTCSVAHTLETDFNAFMIHVMREFSHEHILFLIEITQLRDRILGDSHIALTVSDKCPIRFPRDVPRSQIVYGNKHDDKVSPNSWRALEIYKKYMRPGAIMECNVSWGVRQRLMKIFSDFHSETVISDSELMATFQEAEDEILQLLRDNLSRFSKTTTTRLVLDSQSSLSSGTSKPAISTQSV